MNGNILKKCINSICLDNIDEVIVVDNASTDETSEMLKLFPFRIVRSDNNVGCCEGYNIGFKLAKTDYIYFTNNDTILNTTTITALFNRIISDDRLGAVGSKIIHPTGHLIEAGGYFTNNRAWQRGCLGNAEDYNNFEIVDYCSTCSLLFRKSLIPDGLDLLFSPGYYDDVDLCTQIKKQGYLIGYEPLSIILHYESVTFKSQNLDKNNLTERNRIKYIDKWNL